MTFTPNKFRLPLICALFSALLLSACASAPTKLAEPPAPLGEVTASANEDWARLPGPDGLVLINNVWNRQAASAGQQRIYQGNVAGQPSRGWQWAWSASRVVAYPEIVLGDKPWDEPAGIKTAFPLRAAEADITAELDADLVAEGSYNLTFSLWAVADPAKPKASLRNEIMVWLTRKGLSPAGERADSITLDGQLFDVYVRHGHADDSGSTAATWRLTTYVLREPMLKGRLHLSAITDDLIRRRWLAPDAWLTSVELGNEVMSGTGRTELRQYRVEARPRSAP